MACFTNSFLLSSVKAGIIIRIHSPSLLGVYPSWASKIAFSILAKINELTKISIDYHSFATSCNPNPHGSFNISNCEKLESIQLGDFTFTHHSDSFTIRNLPSLRHLDIGKIGIYSLNFYWASFCVRGICLWCVTIWNRSTETRIDCIGKWGIRIVFTHSIREYDIDVSKWVLRFDLFGKDWAWRESIDGTGWRYL